MYQLDTRQSRSKSGTKQTSHTESEAPIDWKYEYTCRTRDRSQRGLNVLSLSSIQGLKLRPLGEERIYRVKQTYTESGTGCSKKGAVTPRITSSNCQI